MSEAVLSEEEVKEYTYILIKNLEAKRVNSDTFLKLFSENKSIKSLINNLTIAICNSLDV